jgi:hypothetical protein
VIRGQEGTRWLVRLWVPRRGGWRERGAAKGDFERRLAGEESPVPITPAPVREWGDPAQLPADKARDIPGQPGGQCRQPVFVTQRCDIRVQGDPRHRLGHVLVPELVQVGQELLQLLI